jgi:hypothetical protein
VVAANNPEKTRETLRAHHLYDTCGPEHFYDSQRKGEELPVTLRVHPWQTCMVEHSHRARVSTSCASGRNVANLLMLSAFVL